MSFNAIKCIMNVAIVVNMFVAVDMIYANGTSFMPYTKCINI